MENCQDPSTSTIFVQRGYRGFGSLLSTYRADAKLIYQAADNFRPQYVNNQTEPLALTPCRLAKRKDNGSHFVHLGTLCAPFRYPLFLSFLLNIQYLSFAGISDSFLQVATALSRARQLWFVCLIPSVNAAITLSTARRRRR